MNAVRVLQTIIGLCLAIGGVGCQRNQDISEPSGDQTPTGRGTSSDAELDAKNELQGADGATTDRGTETAEGGTENKDEDAATAKERREIRSRKISALKDRISAERNLLQLKESQRVSLVNARTAVDGKSIESYNKTGQTGSIVSGVSQIGGNNSVGGALAAGIGFWGLIADAMKEAEQKGEVLSARDAVELQILRLEAEISELKQAIDGLEEDLDEMIDPND